MLGIRGLVPPRTLPLSAQVAKLLVSVRAVADPLDKAKFLYDLCDRNETLFYRILVDHVQEFAPIVYTPTVGQVRGAAPSRRHPARSLAAHCAARAARAQRRRRPPLRPSLSRRSASASGPTSGARAACTFRRRTAG